MSKRKGNRGISLRVFFCWLVVIAVIVLGLTILSIVILTKNFEALSDATKEQIELDGAAHELMDASDYLTENVQRFTIEGDRTFLDNYFKEANVTKRREDAVSKMSENPNSADALRQLQDAKKASVDLMQREYYSMLLVIKAKGYTGYPEEIDTVKLSPEDEKLSPEDKMHLATKMVLDDEYYSQKEKIHLKMEQSLALLEELTMQQERDAFQHVHNNVINVFLMSILQTACIIILVVMTSNLGVKPILKAVEKIRTDNPIPEIGANEFRYLAHTYNKMYTIYKGSLERLNFKASHDELTGAYNRSGYELLLTSVDLSTTHMILFDLDNFKGINDNYGHETGDKILIKLVRTLQHNFRNDDYICRIGGDEFVVFMVHSSDMQKSLISSKITHINEELSDINDGLPPISVSVGIVHGTKVSGTEMMFEKADEAMYKSKQNGKSTCTFYSE